MNEISCSREYDLIKVSLLRELSSGKVCSVREFSSGKFRIRIVNEMKYKANNSL